MPALAERKVGHVGYGCCNLNLGDLRNMHSAKALKWMAPALICSSLAEPAITAYRHNAVLICDLTGDLRA